MSKEITLEDLANSVKSTTTEKKVENKPEEVKQEKQSFADANIKAGESVSVSALTSHMKKLNKTEEDLSDQAPMVRDAFKAMYDTIEDRKKRIETELMPIVMANAEEMAIQRELGVDVENTKLDDINNEDKDTDATPTVIDNAKEKTESFDIDDIELDDSEEQPKEVTVEKKYVVHEEEPVVEEKKASKERTKNTNTVIEENSSDDDLESLIKDLDAEEKLDVEEDDEDTAEEIRARFKESLTSVKIARDAIDIGKFKIRKTAVSSASALSNISNRPRDQKSADWALYYTGRSMKFAESRGPELDALRKTINNSNGVNGVIASLRFIYEHTIDANKPAFESWCKLIRTEDIESLYFGLYRACYADANLVARACIGKNGCKKTSLIDTDINTMVKFDDDKVKEKFYSILNKDTTTETQTFESELIQISDDFVISYTMPTLYSTFIQYATLKPEVTEKYSDILNTMAYIDGFFTIDRANQELIPIAIKEYPNNINKTVLSKLKTYTEILKMLTNDQYNILTAKLNNIVQTSKITYIYPEATCPECGSTIAEEPVDSMLNLLFTRAQLVQIKSL